MWRSENQKREDRLSMLLKRAIKLVIAGALTARRWSRSSGDAKKAPAEETRPGLALPKG